MGVKVVEDKKLSKDYKKRYVVIDEETGKVLDNAQGYGYKTIRNAYAAYGYKNRDKSKDKEKKEKCNRIRKWMKENKGFVKAMNQYSFEIAKGSWGPDGVFDAKFVKAMLKDYDLHPDFTAGELLKVWRNN